MFIDNKTRKLLEVDRVLAELHPITPFGQRCKSDMQLFDVSQEAELQMELDRIEKLLELIDTQRSIFVDIRNNMRQLKDLQKSIERSMSGVTLNAVELFELKSFSLIIKSIAAIQSLLHWTIPERYKIYELLWLDELLDPDKSGIRTFYIYDSYSSKLAEIRKRKAEAEKSYDEERRQLSKHLQQELGIQLRPSGEINVSRKDEDLLKVLYSHPNFQAAGETYMNVTFKVKPTDEMYSCQKVIEALKEEESIEETKILERLSAMIGERGQEIIDDMTAVGELDLLMAKAYLAIAQKGVKPQISRQGEFKLVNGRHPIVEEALKKKSKQFTQISMSLSRGVALITGANMGGKTVSLKLTGLLTAMLHYGLFVPAEHMEAPMCEFIHITAGDEQSIDQGLSTFGAEMKSLKEALLKSDKSGLILIDELARGTNPHEGYAISASIIDYLMKKKCITLITTHFDGLVREGVRHLQVRGLRSIDFGAIQNPENISQYMDYTLIEIAGSCSVPKDAINIARLMELPEEILANAEKVFKARCI